MWIPENKYGFLISMRKDKRRQYILSDFKLLAQGIKASKSMGELSIPEKLKKAYNEYDKKYLITGGSAAFIYHTYQFPLKEEIEIFPKDYGFWSFFNDIEIYPILKEREFREKVVIDGLFVARPEKIILEGLRQGSITSILDSVSILVSEKGLEFLEWEKLKKYAREYGVIKELGAILEIIDNELKHEYGRSFIPQNFINALFADIKEKGRLRQYPKNILVEDKTYSAIGDRWRLKLYLPAYVVKKPVEDIAPLTLKVI